MIRVAPLASVKSVSAHIVLHTVGGCGFGIGMSWSSAWIGCGVSPAQIAIDDSDEMRHPSSSTPSTIGQHVGVDRDPLERLAVHEQVVDADGLAALEVVGRRHDAEVDLEAVQLVVELVEQVGLDGVLDDRVALLATRSRCRATSAGDSGTWGKVVAVTNLRRRTRGSTPSRSESAGGRR